MHITAKWFKDQFNVSLHSKEGAEEFLTIKGCRIVKGKDGEFVGFPATNGQNDKWWTHVWANEKFQAEAIKVAKAAQPSQKKESAPAADSDDIPF